MSLEAILGIVGGAVGLISLLIGVLTYRSRRKKELSYGVVARTALLSTTRPVSERLEIRFEDEAVHDVHLAIVTLLNSGNAAIDVTDYREGPLRLRLADLSPGSVARLLTVEVLDTIPEGLRSSVATMINENRAEIQPLLLNPGDAVVLQMIVAPFPKGTIALDARLVDVKVRPLKFGGLTIPTALAGFAAVAGWMLMITYPTEFLFWLGIGLLLLSGGAFFFASRRTAKRKARLSAGFTETEEANTAD